MTKLFQRSSVLPKEQLTEWERFLEKNTGIQLTPSQHILFQTQVTLRMKELGISDYNVYFNFLQMDVEGVAEWQVLVDRLVVKETSFFRHRPSLDLVRQFLLNRLAQKEQQSSFEILSVGCSTGEEPYALAALVNDCYEDSGHASYFGVTAVDISLPALSIARQGVYSTRSMKLMDPDEKEHYFELLDDGLYKVKDKIKNRVCFSQVNVLHLEEKPVQLMDVIYCQNMLIYFRRWRRRHILNELVRRLKPGGILVIGLGEITDWHCPSVERVANKEVHAYIRSF